MKITEAYSKRDAFLQALRDNNACPDQYARHKDGESEEEFTNIILNNFRWCVKKGILEEWLPKVILNATVIDCSGCILLPELNAPKATLIYCSGCTSLTELNAPKATEIYRSGSILKPNNKGNIK